MKNNETEVKYNFSDTKDNTCVVRVLAAPLTGLEGAEADGMLSPGRKAELARLTKPAARRQAIGAELLLRCVL